MWSRSNILSPPLFINYPRIKEEADLVPSILIPAVLTGTLSQLPIEAFTPEEIKVVDHKKWNVLHWAACKGVLGQLPKQFHDSGYFHSLIGNYHCENSITGKSPLHIAAEFGQLDKVPDSLCTYDLFNKMSFYGETVFHTALRCQCIQQIPKKLFTYESLALRDFFGWSVFHHLIYRELHSLIPSDLLPKFLRVLDFPFPDFNLFSAPALALFYGFTKSQNKELLIQYAEDCGVSYHRNLHPEDRLIEYVISPTHTSLLNYRLGRERIRFHRDGSIRDGFRKEIIPWLPYCQRVQLGIELPSSFSVSDHRTEIIFMFDSDVDYYDTNPRGEVIAKSKLQLLPELAKVGSVESYLSYRSKRRPSRDPIEYYI